MQQFRTYDEEQERLLLDPNYFFACSYYDGFSADLVSISCLVDYAFNYELQISQFQQLPYTTKGVLPVVLQEHLWTLMLGNCQLLKPQYGAVHEGISSHYSSYQYLVNFETRTSHIILLDQPSPALFEAKEEQLLYQMHLFIRDWFSQLYQTWAGKALNT